MFTGAEGIKTPEEAAIFGGTAGQPYDSCYHQACDTIANINDKALALNTGAIATAAAVYAYSKDLPGPDTRTTATARTAKASGDIQGKVKRRPDRALALRTAGRAHGPQMYTPVVVRYCS